MKTSALCVAMACVLSGFLAARAGGHDAFVMVAIFLASVVGSIAGFAFSAICGAMLFHFSDDPVHIVQIMMTCSIANQVTMTWAVRRDIVWRGLCVYLLGGALGLQIGIWVLLNVDRSMYTHALGTFLVLYGAFTLLRKPMVVRRPHLVLDFATGLLSGVTGGAAAFPSAFVSIWCSMKGWDKARQRGVLQPFILIMQVVALLAIGIAQHGGAGTGVGLTDLLFVPAALLGTTLGMGVFRRLSDRQFGRVVNVLLIVSGVSFVA